jgi:hypothetical protein
VLIGADLRGAPISARPGSAPGPALAATREGPARGLRLTDCYAPGSLLAQRVDVTARKVGVDPRALSVRVLLHLPRVATLTGEMTRDQLDRELFHNSRQLREDVRAAGDLVSAREFALQDLVFAPIPAERAEAVFRSLHYLKSARPGSVNFALLDPVGRLPVSLCSVSPLESRRVGGQIHARFGVPPERIWEVSRVYLAHATPPNAISFLLARVRGAVRRRVSGLDLLVTAVDPNLGFTGASYRAANWQQWLAVASPPYLYHDRRHVSPRQLRQRFGTCALAELKARYPGQRFEQSQARLRDSLVFCCRLTGETEALPEDP